MTSGMLFQDLAPAYLTDLKPYGKEFSGEMEIHILGNFDQRLKVCPCKLE